VACIRCIALYCMTQERTHAVYCNIAQQKHLRENLLLEKQRDLTIWEWLLAGTIISKESRQHSHPKVGKNTTSPHRPAEHRQP
jgi:hypothetical protein